MIFQNCFRGDLSVLESSGGKKIQFHKLGVMCSNPHRLEGEVDFFQCKMLVN
jgi:hypothetical protein